MSKAEEHKHVHLLTKMAEHAEKSFDVFNTGLLTKVTDTHVENASMATEGLKESASGTGNLTKESVLPMTRMFTQEFIQDVSKSVATKEYSRTSTEFKSSSVSGLLKSTIKDKKPEITLSHFSPLEIVTGAESHVESMVKTKTIPFIGNIPNVDEAIGLLPNPIPTNPIALEKSPIGGLFHSDPLGSHIQLPELHLPEPHLPHLPEPHLPHLPELDLPHLPEPHLPHLPEPHLPHLPELHLPNLDPLNPAHTNPVVETGIHLFEKMVKMMIDAVLPPVLSFFSSMLEAAYSKLLKFVTYFAERPFLSVPLLTFLMTLLTPVFLFVLFAFTTTAVTFIGFMMAEGTVLAMACVILIGFLVSIFFIILLFISTYGVIYIGLKCLNLVK